MTDSSLPTPKSLAVSPDLHFSVLGCDGSYAGPGGACSGYLISTATERVWLDAGPGTLARLQRHVDLVDLTAVVVSHEHPDHSGELPVLRNALRYLLGVAGLRVITTEGTRRVVEHVTGGAEPTFLWDVVRGGDQRRVGDLLLRFVTADHSVETVAVRVDHASGSIVYTADTGSALDGRLLDPDGTGVDLLVIEATMSEDDEGAFQHLSAAEAARLAVAAGARTVLVTHVAPGTDPHRRRDEVAAAMASAGSSATVLCAADHQTVG